MKTFVTLVLSAAMALPALAQDAPTAPSQTPQGQTPGGEPPNRERRQGYMRNHFGRGVLGEITAVNPDGFTVKTMQGNSATIKITSETKFMREQQEIKKTDLKVGDTIGVSGSPDANDPTTWSASFVMDRTAQVKQFKENLGKTLIAGEVKGIAETKLTILRPDGETQTIEADENTSFQKGREKITLADIKVGDHVSGKGAVKDGVFVPTELHVGGFGMGPGMGGGMGRGAGAEGSNNAPQPK
jgi:hypothetical protein